MNPVRPFYNDMGVAHMKIIFVTMKGGLTG